MRNILSSFDDFEGNEIISQRDMQDYQSEYIDLYQELKKPEKDKEVINDDLIFEMELVRQVEVNIDYILMLVTKYHESNCKDKNILVTIDKAINSSLELRSKKELIEQFIERVNAFEQVDDAWRAFVKERKEAELDALITEERLKPDLAKTFMENALRDGTLKTTGTGVERIMPPMPRFGQSNRAQKKQGIIEKLQMFFEKYFGIG